MRAAPRVWFAVKAIEQPDAAGEAANTSESAAAQPFASRVSGVSLGEPRGVAYTPYTPILDTREAPVRGAVLNHSAARLVAYAYMPVRAGEAIWRAPAVFQPDRRSRNDMPPLDRKEIVPWFTSEPTTPVKALAESPAGAVASTVKLSVSALVTVPVTAAADVEPGMPVQATLTPPEVADTAGVLNRGADTELATYESSVGSKVMLTCHDVSWFVPVKKSMGSVMVSPAYREHRGRRAYPPMTPNDARVGALAAAMSVKVAAGADATVMLA